jgi:catechol 2,3-dioxygenase
LPIPGGPSISSPRRAHGANEAVYLEDPDGNGLELYWDRPHAECPRTQDGRLALVNLPLDVEELASGA